MATRGDLNHGLAGMINDGWLISGVKSVSPAFDVDNDWSMSIERFGLPVGRASQSAGGMSFDCHFDSDKEAGDFRAAAVRNGLLPDEPLLDLDDAVIALAYSHQVYVEAQVTHKQETAVVHAAVSHYRERFSHEFVEAQPEAAQKRNKGMRLGS